MWRVNVSLLQGIQISLFSDGDLFFASTEEHFLSSSSFLFLRLLEHVVEQILVDYVKCICVTLYNLSMRRWQWAPCYIVREYVKDFELEKEKKN